MSNEREIAISALRVVQPVGEFYVGVIKSSDLIEISTVDVRTIENELDKYLGIQRKLSPTRVKELVKYVKTIDATFPTSIVLAVDESCAKWDDDNKKIILKETEDIRYGELAKVLDGQHRIEGLKDYRKDDFELTITVFIGADIADQANIFATVNLAQTKVNKSLVYDLYDYSHSRSPQKTAHDIVVAIDRINNSPFFHMIKRLGFATPGRTNETLTQAALVETLLKYFISKTALEDRDTLLKGKKLLQPDYAELKKLPFRKLFIDGDDLDITKIIIEYFSAVQEKWPGAWMNRSERGNILPKTNGVRALFRFLQKAYVHLTGDSNIGRHVTKSEFKSLLDKVSLNDNDFTIDNFPPGTSGEAALLAKLHSDTDVMR